MRAHQGGVGSAPPPLWLLDLRPLQLPALLGPPDQPGRRPPRPLRRPPQPPLRLQPAAAIRLVLKPNPIPFVRKCGCTRSTWAAIRNSFP